MASWIEDQDEQQRADVADTERTIDRLTDAVPVSAEADVMRLVARHSAERSLARLRGLLTEAEA
jgi:hypothetical protein